MLLRFGKIPLNKYLVLYNIEIGRLYLLYIIDYNKLFIKAYAETYENDILSHHLEERIKTSDILDISKNVFIGEL